MDFFTAPTSTDGLSSAAAVAGERPRARTVPAVAAMAGPAWRLPRVRAADSIVFEVLVFERYLFFLSVYEYFIGDGINTIFGGYLTRACNPIK